MSALKDAVKPKATTKNSSDKNPAYYSRMKNEFIKAMSVHPDESVRIAVAGSEFVPAGTLKTMLKTESDTDVLRVLILNERTPIKSITEFAGTDSATVFEDDEEIISFLKNRISGDDEDAAE